MQTPHQSQDPSWTCVLYLISKSLDTCFSMLSTSRGWPSCWRCRWCCRRSAATWTPSGADMSGAAGTLPRRTRTARTTTSRTSAAQSDFPCFIAGKYVLYTRIVFKIPAAKLRQKSSFLRYTHSFQFIYEGKLPYKIQVSCLLNTVSCLKKPAKLQNVGLLPAGLNSKYTILYRMFVKRNV